VLWSQITIPGKLRLLVVDSSRNHQGWEAEFCSRIFNVLERKGMDLSGERPLKVDRPQDLSEALRNQGAFNCLFLVGHGAQVPEESKLSSFWRWLSSRDGLTPKLFAVCTFEDHDPDTSQSILSAEDTFAQFAIVPQSPISPRGAGLFFMKFFTELDLHSSDGITGRMVWFSRSKARELLRKRRLPGEIAARC
jgi:hypothetical protein